MRKVNRAALHDLLDRAQPSLDATARASLFAWLDEHEARPPEPVLMNVLAGFGAWVASLFIVAFVALSLTVSEEWGAIVSGIALLGVGYVLLRRQALAFLRQMALAFAVAGNALLLGGIVFLAEAPSFVTAVFVQIVILAVTYPLLASSGYRFIATASVFALATAWCVEEQPNASHALFAVELVLTGVLLYARTAAPSTQPMLYAAALALPAEFVLLEVMLGFSPSTELPSFVMWPAQALFALALALTLFQLHRLDVLTRSAFAAALVVLLPLALLATPGVLLGALLLITAYATADRALGIAAALFMPWFLFHYYHALDVTLAWKSLVITASGVLLLLAGALLGAREKAA